MDYIEFLHSLNNQLNDCFQLHKNYIQCEAGCSSCCENGDYPISQIEFDYLAKGYINLDNSKKIMVQENIKNMKRGACCPFLIDKKCSIYDYRPIICRVHGLAYLIDNDVVKVPYCVNEGKNYSKVYENGTININPINRNLDTLSILKNFDYGEYKNLYDWFKQ